MRSLRSLIALIENEAPRMTISEFIGETEPDDSYEQLGVPPVPKTITRKSLRSYRDRLLAFAETVRAKDGEEGRVLRYQHRYGAQFGKKRTITSRKRKAVGYWNNPDFESATKQKKRDEFARKQRGTPYHQREENPLYAAIGDRRTCRDVVKKILQQINERFPNLPPEPKVEPKRGRPVIAPEIDEFD